MNACRVTLDREPSLEQPNRADAVPSAPSTRAGLERSQQFYHGHPEANRTLRMDNGGLCHLCGRKAARRVEMHTPLWPAGPIMYGDCCAVKAEAALQALCAQAPSAAIAASPADKSRSGSQAGAGFAASGGLRRLWLTVTAATGLGLMVACIERLLHLS